MTSGTGIKNKLLEAMAAGAPCVVTPLALQGLTAEPGRDVLVGADAQELADELVRVLRDDESPHGSGRPPAPTSSVSTTGDLSHVPTSACTTSSADRVATLA